MTTQTTAGALLAAARIERGLTVEDVAARTCIRPGLLRAIEADDFAPCGATVYARGHVRNTAVALGLDPAEALARFDGARGAVAEPQGARALETHQPEVRRRQERRGPHWTAAMAVTTAVVAVLAVVAVVTPEDDAGPAGGTEAAAAVPTAAPTAPVPTPAARPAAPRPAPAAARPAGVLVRLRVTGAQSWVRVRDAADRTVVEQVLAGGTVTEFRDPRRLTLRIGNPAAVVLQVNGVKVRLPGDPRQPVTVVYGPGDPTVATG